MLIFRSLSLILLRINLSLLLVFYIFLSCWDFNLVVCNFGMTSRIMVVNSCLLFVDLKLIFDLMLFCRSLSLILLRINLSLLLVFYIFLGCWDFNLVVCNFGMTSRIMVVNSCLLFVDLKLIFDLMLFCRLNLPKCVKIGHSLEIESYNATFLIVG